MHACVPAELRCSKHPLAMASVFIYSDGVCADGAAGGLHCMASSHYRALHG